MTLCYVDSIGRSIIPTAVKWLIHHLHIHHTNDDDRQTVKDGVKLDAKKMKDAIERVQVLEAYLDEVRRGVTLVDRVVSSCVMRSVIPGLIWDCGGVDS